MTKYGGSWSWPFRLVGALGIGGAMIALSGNFSIAQIKPNTTLGAESSSVRGNVRIKGLPSDQINGGARRGGNLFHSFSEFNVNEGRGAYFINPPGIENILSWVTGTKPRIFWARSVSRGTMPTCF